jgi:hypothetical protein
MRPDDQAQPVYITDAQWPTYMDARGSGVVVGVSHSVYVDHYELSASCIPGGSRQLPCKMTFPGSCRYGQECSPCVPPCRGSSQLRRVMLGRDSQCASTRGVFERGRRVCYRSNEKNNKRCGLHETRGKHHIYRVILPHDIASLLTTPYDLAIPKYEAVGSHICTRASITHSLHASSRERRRHRQRQAGSRQRDTISPHPTAILKQPISPANSTARPSSHI